MTSSTQVRVQVVMNAGAAAYGATLRITNTDGKFGDGTFQVNAPPSLAPRIDNISHSPIDPDVPKWLTVTGANFRSGFSASVIPGACTFPISSGNLIFDSSTQVRVQVVMNAAAAAYSATLRVTNTDGKFGDRTWLMPRLPNSPDR